MLVHERLGIVRDSQLRRQSSIPLALDLVPASGRGLGGDGRQAALQRLDT
jgi:hypothetical protein